MAELTTGMLRDAVRSLDESDAAMAQRVCQRDSELDAEFAAALRQLLTLAMQDQRFLSATIDTVFALKGLERIGDHAKNIAEQVVFVASGEDVRHQSKNEVSRRERKKVTDRSGRTRSLLLYPLRPIQSFLRSLRLMSSLIPAAAR